MGRAEGIYRLLCITVRSFQMLMRLMFRGLGWRLRYLPGIEVRPHSSTTRSAIEIGPGPVVNSTQLPSGSLIFIAGRPSPRFSGPWIS